MCVRVDEVPEVAAWLTSKRIDATAVADRDLARALPPSTPARKLPQWAGVHRSSSWSPWSSRGYLLIAQQVDVHGAVRSVLARNVLGREPKSLAPGGGKYGRTGLVLACGLARQILEAGRAPTWWPADLAVRWEVTEGEKKFAIRATERGDVADTAPAVLGIESGSWTPELAARIPDGSSVYIATDHNAAGAAYATKIAQSLLLRAVRVVLRPGFELVNADAILTVRCV